MNAICILLLFSSLKPTPAEVTMGKWIVLMCNHQPKLFQDQEAHKPQMHSAIYYRNFTKLETYENRMKFWQLLAMDAGSAWLSDERMAQGMVPGIYSGAIWGQAGFPLGSQLRHLYHLWSISVYFLWWERVWVKGFVRHPPQWSCGGYHCWVLNLKLSSGSLWEPKEGTHLED